MKNAKLFIKYLVSILGMALSGAIFFITMQNVFFGYGTNVMVMVACLIAFVVFSRLYDKLFVEE